MKWNDVFEFETICILFACLDNEYLDSSPTRTYIFLFCWPAFTRLAQPFTNFLLSQF